MPRTRILVMIILLAVAAVPVGAAQLKIATLAPDGSYWMNEVRKAGDEIKERTSGRVSIRIYPGGTMGKDQAILRKMRIGQLQGGMVVGGTLAGVAPDLHVYGLPMIFRSYEEVDYARQRMDEQLVAKLEEKGYVSFGFIEGGFAYIMSNKPTRSFEDLKGRKAWIPEGDVVGQAILEAAGLTPVPLPLSDVLTGLQTGLIDTVAGPPVGAVALQWFTRAKYFTDMPILYSYGSIVLSKKAFNKLGAADQKVIREVMGKVTKALDARARKDNQSARKALAKQGIQFIEMSAEGSRQWQDVAAKATRRLNDKGEVPAAMAEVIRSHLQTFRSAAGG